MLHSAYDRGAYAVEGKSLRGGGGGGGDAAQQRRPCRAWCGACASAASAACADLPSGLRGALWRSATSRYMLANATYVLYTFVVLYVDLVAQPAVNSALEPRKRDRDAALVDRTYKALYDLYKAAAWIHLINALQYVWAWLPSGFGLFSWVQTPEYLNIVGAALYLHTAYLYETVGGNFDAETLQVHYYETAASAIELAAAVGWCVTWWWTYPRGVVGRGWTLDDFDLWGCVCIIVPSMLYLAYNLIIILNPEEYSTNTLYADGNIMYAAGALLYFCASLRDDSWLDFLATGGACPHGCDAATPIELPAPREAGDGAELGVGVVGAGKRFVANVLLSKPSEAAYGDLEAPSEASTLLRSPSPRRI
jgi:hypothetical protein